MNISFGTVPKLAGSLIVSRLLQSVNMFSPGEVLMYPVFSFSVALSGIVTSLSAVQPEKTEKFSTAFSGILIAGRAAQF